MRLSATDLACRRGGRDVFAGVSFSVASGESLTIRGRNGAGKSSLLRMMAGLVRVAGGQLSLEGGDPELTLGEQAHYLGHLDALKPSLSVEENLRFWSAFLGAAAADLGEPLRAVGLDTLSDLPAAYLSAGQRRRLSIARLLTVKRPLWLLDEPTSTLDAAAQVPAGRDHAGALGRRRHHPRGDARPAATRRRAGAEPRWRLRAEGGDGNVSMTPLVAILIRDMRIAVRVGGGALMGVLFFLVVVTLIPFALGPDLALLKRIGPAILWLAALLASLLALDRLFVADHDDGSLDLILMGRAPLEIVVAAKGLAHWLTTGLPLVIAAPLIGLFLNLDAPAAGALVLTLLVGTPALTFIGLIGAAIAVTLRRGGLLLAVLVLPLTVPVLIFGVAAANAAVIGPIPFGTPFTILCALTLASLVVGPFAAAAALRQEME